MARQRSEAESPGIPLAAQLFESLGDARFSRCFFDVLAHPAGKGGASELGQREVERLKRARVDLLEAARRSAVAEASEVIEEQGSAGR